MSPPEESAPDGGDGFDDSPVEVREKIHTSAPMTLADALREMELVGHDFYLFHDVETDKASVVIDATGGPMASFTWIFAGLRGRRRRGCRKKRHPDLPVGGPCKHGRRERCAARGHRPVARTVADDHDPIAGECRWSPDRRMTSRSSGRVATGPRRSTRGRVGAGRC